jgi:hypothetical protein
MQQAFIPVIASIVALAGVWIGSRLTSIRSHRDWLRDRMAQAYSALLEALFDMEIWFSANLEDHYQSREVDDETKQRRREAYQAAKHRLDRTIAREEWLLPASAIQAFLEMRTAFEARYETWHDDLDASWGAVTQTRQRLIESARTTLGKAP